MLKKRLTQRGCCALLTCSQNNQAAWNFLWKNSDLIQNRQMGRCAVSGSRWRRGGVVVRRCWPAALRPEALARAVVTRLGQLGGGRETKVERRQKTKTDCQLDNLWERESNREPNLNRTLKMPDPCMVTVKAGPQHSRVGLTTKRDQSKYRSLKYYCTRDMSLLYLEACRRISFRRSHQTFPPTWKLRLHAHYTVTNTIKLILSEAFSPTKGQWPKLKETLHIIAYQRVISFISPSSAFHNPQALVTFLDAVKDGLSIAACVSRVQDQVLQKVVGRLILTAKST